MVRITLASQRDDRSIVDLSDGQDAMVRTVQISENRKISDVDPLSKI